MSTKTKTIRVQRVQTGVRIEKRILKVLKSLAEYFDITLGDLLEGIVLHAFEGKCAFSDKTLKHIIEFKKIYGIDFDASASHRMIDQDEPMGPGQENVKTIEK
jgi:hypothetical protein